ncbi:MAG: NUDIX hydrolase [Anaerolineales bacterium]|nr:NUDIX domain-containing protein [Anaerolineae bacterium]PWB74382.1 MAG: NUDIX hydrolase [Anaerolineales bacterium]
MPEELFDIIDENDRVIGQETRTVVHQRGLWHRGVHILLFDRRGRLLVQQRSEKKSQSPLALDCSVSEHVQAGEDYYHAAIRGLSEELGLDGVEIQPLIKFKLNYGPNDNEISTIYKGSVHREQFNFDPAEIERVDFYSLTEIQKIMEQKTAPLSYWFKQILLWLLGNPSDLHTLDNWQEK